MRYSLKFVGKCPQHRNEIPFIEGKPLFCVLEVYKVILGEGGGLRNFAYFKAKPSKTGNCLSVNFNV